MKIAVASDKSKVSGHFGYCEGFEIFNIEDNKINGKEFVANPGHKPGFLPVFLKEKGANVIIAGGMGGAAQNLFVENGIEVVVGAEGACEDVVNAYISGNLKSTGSVCNEHSHEH